MSTFHRFFVSFLFTSLLTAYAPLTQADHQPEQQRSYGSKIGNKALNGFANLTTSTLEIPKNIINATNQSNIFYGLTGGLFKGVLNTVGRMAVGITDLITFPLPTKPIARPVYIWDDFDVDTTYGDLFRLDRSPDIEEPVIEEPVAQSVAPVAVAPKEPVDFDQNQQDINRKLDTLFKKRMLK